MAPDSSPDRSALAEPSQLIVPDCLALFLGFTRIALSGFGGVLPFAYRGMVENQRWLTPADFAQLLAASQILPGPTICNMSLMVGWRFHGLKGALHALAGMLVAPFFLIILLGMAYQRFGDLEPVKAALGGMSAVATGLIAATATKMALPLLKSPVRRGMHIALALLAFGALALLKFPMVAVIGILAPLGIGLAYWSTKAGNEQ